MSENPFFSSFSGLGGYIVSKKVKFVIPYMWRYEADVNSQAGTWLQAKKIHRGDALKK